MSPKDFRPEFIEKIVRLLWRQWASLGISAEAVNPGRRIIDPEALLCMTCVFGRYEARLFDEGADWIRENGSLINLSRLKRIMDRDGLDCASTISALAVHLKREAGNSKWKAMINDSIVKAELAPFFTSKTEKPGLPIFGSSDEAFRKFGWHRGPFKFSRKSVAVIGDGGAKLLMRLRALFGVNARCEILAYLLDKGVGHPHEIARQTNYFPKTVQDALVQMRSSGLVHSRMDAGRMNYSIQASAWKPLLYDEGEVPRYVNWAMIFSSLALLLRYLEKARISDPGDLMFAAALKTWARKAGPDLERAGVPGVLRPESQFPGESYLPIFLADMEKLEEVIMPVAGKVL